MSERISIDKLKPGMVIIKVTAQNGPVKIKKSGLVNSVDMVKALAEMGVQELEIDPSITVDMPKTRVVKSKTQALMDTTYSSNELDASISEQFNRSLFLPSVQELPEAWQYYIRKVAVVVFLVFGGFALGWSVSQIQNRLNQPVMPPVVASQTPIPVVQTNPAAPSSEAVVAPKEAEQSAAEVRADSVDDLPEPVAQQPLILGIQPEDKVLTQESEEQPAANRISPELLKRFEKAVAAIDETPGDLEPQSPTPQNDVTPVQDLPAWILTQLPSISFSTHMYASQADERWVRVNGKRVTEGQEIEPGLRVVNIEPQHVILAFKGQEFSMEALSDW